MNVKARQLAALRREAIQCSRDKLERIAAELSFCRLTGKNSALMSKHYEAAMRPVLARLKRELEAR